MNLLRCVAVVANFTLCIGVADAADWYTGSNSNVVSTYGMSVDTSLSATTQGDRDLTVIGTIAPFTKLDQSGLRLSVGGDVGQYNYISGAAGVGRVEGHEEDGSFLAGWEWVANKVNVSAYVGPTVRNDELSEFDPDNPSTGTQVGVKTSVDFYANPTPYTMAFGQASYSTVRQAYYTHFKFGFAVADNVFVGPEALFLGDEFYRQWRLGAHLSGVQIGALQFGVSGGFLQDHTRGDGAYGILDMRVAF